MSTKRKPHVLFFANIPVTGEERSVGGATVLAESILTFINNDTKVEVTHQQIRRFWRHKLQLIDYLMWCFRFPFRIRKYDVISFHATQDLHFTIAPVLWFWAKLLNKRTVYHFFGGNFKERFLNRPKFQQRLLEKTILQSDVLFFETKALSTYFSDRGYSQVRWLPNARKQSAQQNPDITFRKRFVYISRIVPQKGVNEIIEAARQLPNSYTIDFYGPIDQRVYNVESFQNEPVTYKGVLKPSEIETTLLDYDVLLLPSYFEGEGYPGIVIEALSLGIPAVVTDWKALPEVIEDKQNGRLIPVRNSDELAGAVRSFTRENYPVYVDNALKSFEKFNSQTVFKKLVNSYVL